MSIVTMMHTPSNSERETVTNIVQVPAEEFDDEQAEAALQAVVDRMRNVRKSQLAAIQKDAAIQTPTVQPDLVEA